MEKTKLHT